MDKILVGVDGSEGSAHALRWAVEEGRLRGWEVEALLAWGFLDQHHTIVSEGFQPGYGTDEALAALDGYVTEAVGPEQAASVRRQTVADLPARALIDASHHAELVVVGARGLGGFKGLLLGSVSQKVLNHAGCPVAVIRQDDVDPPSTVAPRVVVGVDGSDSALRALEWAADEARARQATLEVVHAWLPPYVGGYAFSPPMVDFAPFEDAARTLVATVLEEAELGDLPEPIDQTIVSAGPASALLQAAERAHVLVVGDRGLGGLQRFFLGSISNQVAIHATRPVIVVRPDAEG